ncbi:hypothetical protein U1Q18_051159, partial [Sarracenia purpurea var. burkii]
MGKIEAKAPNGAAEIQGQAVCENKQYPIFKDNCPGVMNKSPGIMDKCPEKKVKQSA